MSATRCDSLFSSCVYMLSSFARRFTLPVLIFSAFRSASDILNLVYLVLRYISVTLLTSMNARVYIA